MSKNLKIATGAYFAPENKPSWSDVGGGKYWVPKESGSVTNMKAGMRYVHAKDAEGGFFPNETGTGSDSKSSLGNSGWWFKESWVNNYRGGGVDVTGRGVFSNEVVLRAREYNQMSIDNTDTNLGKLVGKIKCQWYNNTMEFGCRRGNSSDVQGFTAYLNGTMIFSANADGTGYLKNGRIYTQDWHPTRMDEVTTGQTKRDGSEESLADIIQELRSEIAELKAKAA